MVILCPAMVGSGDAAKLGDMMDLTRGEAGFFDELNGRLHTAQSKVKGIYLAGTCQAPMDIAQATSQAMAAAGLDHPNIVPVYEAGDVDGQSYFTMELIEGGSLAQ